MYSFSDNSLKKLAGCDPRLQAIAHAAIMRMDFTVLEGHRGEYDQNHAYELKVSRLKWPNSKHNATPSLAMDLAPTPLAWGDIAGFRALAVIIKEEASILGIPIVWGGDWVMRDYDHFEIGP